MKIPNLPIEKLKAGGGPRLTSAGPSASAASAAADRGFSEASAFLGLSSKTKFVLFLGDEGAILIHIKGNTVQSRKFVPDGNADHLRELQIALGQDVKAPVLVVIDTMDQSYVQQTLPPVSPLSINKLIKRRLDRDFAESEIKGAVILGREQSGRKDWNFMMVALEKSPQLSTWINFIFEVENRFQGICLLPTEAELIVSQLESAMGISKEGTGSEWKFFVSHNKVGGVRQVIMRHGRIAFTRMTQLVGETTPEVIAGNIEQEVTSTLEYVRRLGFEPEAGLDIYIIASSALKQLIDQSKFTAASMHVLTPYEVAQYLAIEGATQQNDQFGDVILAAAIGRCKKHVLTLTTPLLRKLNALYQISLGQRVAAVLIALSIIGYTCDVLYDVGVTYTKKSDLEQIKIFREKTLESLREEVKKSNMDVEKAADLIDLYQRMQKDELTPVPFFAQVSAIIKRPIEIKKITWSLDDDKATGATPKMTAVFTLNFPGVDSLEAFKVISKKVLGELQDAFKGADIKFTKLPAKFSESAKMDISFDSDKPSPSTTVSNTSSEVELTIKGDVLTGDALKTSPPGQAAPLLHVPLPSPSP